jgi:GxxExxY protein
MTGHLSKTEVKPAVKKLNRKVRKGFARFAKSVINSALCAFFALLAVKKVKIWCKRTTTMTENELSKAVYEAALRVHKTLGPGLLESAYEECMYYELIKEGFRAEKQKPMPLIYEDVKLEVGYRIDILLENKLVIEVKSVEALNDVHLAQILTYLKLSNCKLGMLINFNVPLIKDGIKRVVNRL